MRMKEERARVTGMVGRWTVIFFLLCVVENMEERGGDVMECGKRAGVLYEMRVSRLTRAAGVHGGAK